MHYNDYELTLINGHHKYKHGRKTKIGLTLQIFQDL